MFASSSVSSEDKNLDLTKLTARIALSLSDRLEISIKILEALLTFHENNGVHNHLRPSTVFYNISTKKISFAPKAERKENYTREFDAPELVHRKEDEKPNPSKQSDIYSLTKTIAQFLNFTTGTATVLLFDKIPEINTQLRAAIRTEMQSILRHRHSLEDCIQRFKRFHTQLTYTEKLTAENEGSTSSLCRWLCLDDFSSFFKSVRQACTRSPSHFSNEVQLGYKKLTDVNDKTPASQSMNL